MTYKGHIENGAVVVDEPVDLPDGTAVVFQPVRLPAGKLHPDLERFAGVIPADLDTKDSYYKHILEKHQ